MIKLKNILTEKKELGGALINKIERLTDVNNHNEARLVLAKEMKLRILVKGYESLIVLHTIFNQMNELMHARAKLDKELNGTSKKIDYMTNNLKEWLKKWIQNN